jgi:16S rRNA (cytidine1402-2'-O)-methyltransferase
VVGSGLATDSFSFGGFLPAKSGQRRQMLAEIRGSKQTQVFYEAPHRAKQAVADIVDMLGGDRHIVIARELTKVHEEFLRGTSREVLSVLESRGDIKGEITLLIGKAEGGEANLAKARLNLPQRLQQIMAEQNLDEKGALKKLAKEMGVSKSEAYRQFQRSK